MDCKCNNRYKCRDHRWQGGPMKIKVVKSYSEEFVLKLLEDAEMMFELCQDTFSGKEDDRLMFGANLYYFREFYKKEYKKLWSKKSK
jgi:hypothetical protein